MKNSLLIITILGFFSASAQFGSGSVRGLITDLSGEAIPFAKVNLIQNGALILGTTTDVKGEFILDNIKDGSYSLRVLSPDYLRTTLTGFEVLNDDITYFHLRILSASDLPDVTCTSADRPIYYKDETTTGKCFFRTEFKRLASF